MAGRHTESTISAVRDENKHFCASLHRAFVPAPELASNPTPRDTLGLPAVIISKPPLPALHSRGGDDATGAGLGTVRIRAVGGTAGLSIRRVLDQLQRGGGRADRRLGTLLLPSRPAPVVPAGQGRLFHGYPFISVNKPRCRSLTPVLKLVSMRRWPHRAVSVPPIAVVRTRSLGFRSDQYSRWISQTLIQSAAAPSASASTLVGIPFGSFLPPPTLPPPLQVASPCLRWRARSQDDVDTVHGQYRIQVKLDVSPPQDERMGIGRDCTSDDEAPLRPLVPGTSPKMGGLLSPPPIFSSSVDPRPLTWPR
ncbi:hypothetical protein MSAN_02051400 [Mycena sanguinolenta]|uniref:Uncharacterized protein n=1 Tax=Mycena sanguinolenta TaxID=230812 RepID=A0A8H7CNP2_9AGAR|nr:hypothetical protein MSAN_02051400 [Mycena sanguinolenta]